MAELPLPDDDGSDPSTKASDSHRHILVQSRRKEEVLEYSLLLASQGIRHWFEFDGEAYVLSVEADATTVAESQLQLYLTENRGYADKPLNAEPLGLRLSPLIFLALPAGIYFWVGWQPWANWLHEKGLADAALMRSGEWWRALTATTLHADDEHLLSNLVSGYFIINLLNHKMGIGTIMFLSTLAAGAANYLVAFASGPRHYSLGFSTVVFSVLGLLAATETLTRPRPQEKNLRTLTPLLSAFFLAVLVGIGEGVDVKAHFFGFGCGALVGAVASFFKNQKPGNPQPNLSTASKHLGSHPIDNAKKRLRADWPQVTLAVCTFSLYALAWYLALAH